MGLEAYSPEEVIETNPMGSEAQPVDINKETHEDLTNQLSSPLADFLLEARAKYLTDDAYSSHEMSYLTTTGSITEVLKSDQPFTSISIERDDQGTPKRLSAHIVGDAHSNLGTNVWLQGRALSDFLDSNSLN